MTDEPLELPDGCEELSLDALSRSFARLFHAGGEEPAPEEQEPDTAHDTESELQPVSPPASEEVYEVTPIRLLEAMLFVGSPDNEPLSAATAVSVMRGVSEPEVHHLVQELNAQYAANGCPYRIVSEGAGYRLALSPRYRGLADKFHGRLKQARLSQAAIDVLAIVAYNQPLTADEVSRLRNMASGAILNQLVRRRLLRIERDEQQPRKPRYYTTPRFLELFGLSSLDDLPQSQDLD